MTAAPPGGTPSVGNEPDPRLGTFLGLLIKVAIAAFLLVLGLYVFTFWRSSFSADPAAFGQFGDYVGGVLNPVVSLLTLLAVLYTLRQAQEVIRQNEKQLEQARQAMADEAAERGAANRRATSLFALENSRRALDEALARAESKFDREVWLDAARILNRGLRLASEITEPAHQDVWQIILHGFRERARRAVGFQNTQVTAGNFFGAPFHDIDSAVTFARQCSAGYQGQPPRMTPLAEQSVLAFLRFGALEKASGEALDRHDKFPEGAEEEAQMVFFPGVRDWLRYIRQHPNYMHIGSQPK